MRRGWLARILILCSLTMVVLTSCYYLAVPARRDPPVATRALLLDETALPVGWRAADIYTVRPGAVDHEGDETLQVNFLGPRLPEGQDGAYHHVYRFKNAALAASAFQRMQSDRYFFAEAEDYASHPRNWQYRSPVADDWRFACTSGCGVIARYDEFVSAFGASMTTPSMTPAALEDVLRAIDQRMVEKLGKALLTPVADDK